MPAGTPAAPTGYFVSQGNGQVFLQWNLVAGALSYQVQRSLDGVTYTNYANPTPNSFLDTAVTVGTVYYYQVASINGAGTGNFTPPQAVIPTMGGEMSLAELQTRCRQRADRLNSNFVTLLEVNSYINQSMYELYDLLITEYEEYFKAPNAIFYTTGGIQSIYPMPNGILTFLENDGVTPFVAAPIYKLLGLDIGLNGANVQTGNNGWVTVDKYNFIDRNRYFYPTPGGTIYGVFNCQYRWMGGNIEFIPTPTANQPFRIQYIPRLPVLLQPTDLTTTSISGWLEYVITDVAIKILQKEESDITVLAAQKVALIQRIEASAMNKDAGRPDTISDSRGNRMWGQGAWGFNGGGW